MTRLKMIRQLKCLHAVPPLGLALGTGITKAPRNEGDADDCPSSCPARFDPIDTDLADPIPGDLMRSTDSGIEPSTLGCARKGLTVSPT